jgi:hypothetical protein
MKNKTEEHKDSYAVETHLAVLCVVYIAALHLWGYL